MDKKHAGTAPKQVIGAKVSPEIRVAIERKAAKDDRTISQTIARLLASHPDLKGYTKLTVA